MPTRGAHPRRKVFTSSTRRDLPDPPRRQERAGRRPRFSLYGVIALVVLVGATGAKFWIATHRPEPAPFAHSVDAARETVTGRKDKGPKKTPLQSRAKVRLPTSESGHSLHLRGRGSVVVLALDAVAALELQKHPESLAQLVRNGSLFSVSGGTAITMQENKNGVIKVLIMEGTMAGREGWAPAGQALAKETP